MDQSQRNQSGRAAVSGVAHESTAEQLAAAVVKLSKSPMVAASGLGGTLKLLVDFLGDQQRRLVDAETRLAVLERRIEGTGIGRCG